MQVLTFAPRVLKVELSPEIGLGPLEIEPQVLEFEEAGYLLEVKVQGAQLVLRQQSGPQTVRDSRSSQRRLNQVS